jgi:hypothetical protein
MPSGNVLDKTMSEAITQSLISYTSDSANWQHRKHCHELFKLLLSYLNGTNQFSSDSYDIDAEKRINFLLILLWPSDTEVLQAQLGEDTARLRIALESWMSVRHRLGAFRSATGYFGWPGEQWIEFLRQLDDVQSTQAMLAYVNLQGFVGREGKCGYVADTFDEAVWTLAASPPLAIMEEHPENTEIIRRLQVLAEQRS